MLKYAAVTNSGDRKNNEDRFISSSVGDKQCFVVCDGLGGHAFGDVAASLTINAFVNELYYCTDLSEYLPHAFETAQNSIFLQQKKQATSKTMKTTAVCTVTDGNLFYVGHVGDSRFYGFKKDGTYIRTRDHSITELLVQSGTIQESDMRNHPNRNMLLKVLGDKADEPLYEITGPFRISDFSAFLLCSDGFWELIDETEMTRAFDNSNSPQMWLDKMIEKINNNLDTTNKDNYTAIAVIV